MGKSILKNALILIISCFFFSKVQAQVVFSDMPFDEAIKKSALSGKLLLVQFISKKCNDQINNVFSLNEMGEIVNNRCISIKLAIDDNTQRKNIEKYNPLQLVGVFFISPSGDLIYKFSGWTDYEVATNELAIIYINNINKAYSKVNEGTASIKELDDEWSNNPDNISAMEKNLEKRRLIGFPTDSLLEIYVSRLPTDSFSSVRTLNVLQLNAPSLFSNANKILRKDIRLFEKAWNSIEIATRVRINDRIKRVSMSKAIKDKDLSEGIRVAEFVASTHVKLSDVDKIFFENMLNYFKGIHDSIKGISLTIKFFDKYYLPLSIDSLKKIATWDRKYVDDAYYGRADTSASMLNVAHEKHFALMCQTYAEDINKGAWYIYSNTENPNYLKKALGYIKKAVELYNSPYALDTYARLLYATGDKSMAISKQEEAIELLKPKYNTREFEEVLSKMKKGEGLNDRSGQ